MVAKSLLIVILFLLNACTRRDIDRHVIADIPEASGICYNPASNTLFVANDEGTLYELFLDGKIKRKKYLGHLDLEGVTCDTKNNRLLVAVEGKEEVAVIDPVNLVPIRTVKIKRAYKGITLLKKDKKHGFEGITLDNRGILYISNQSKHKYPHPDPSVIVIIKNLKHKKASIAEIIDPEKIDISGLAWHKNNLYMVSDTNDKLYRYNMRTKKIDLKIKLPEFAQEGITFAPDGKIFFADDDGHILIFTAKELFR